MKRALALALLVLLCAPVSPVCADIAVPQRGYEPFLLQLQRRLSERFPSSGYVRPVWNNRASSTDRPSVRVEFSMPGPCEYTLTLHPTKGQRPDIRHEGHRTERGMYTTQLALDVPDLAAGEVLEYRVEARATPRVQRPSDRLARELTETHTLTFAGEQGGKVALYFDGKPVGQPVSGAGAANGQERGK